MRRDLVHSGKWKISACFPLCGTLRFGVGCSLQRVKYYNFPLEVLVKLKLLPALIQGRGPNSSEGTRPLHLDSTLKLSTCILVLLLQACGIEQKNPSAEIESWRESRSSSVSMSSSSSSSVQFSASSSSIDPTLSSPSALSSSSMVSSSAQSPGVVWEKVFRDDLTYDSITDQRDQQVYRVVRIAGLNWMAQNVNYAGLGSCYDAAVSCGVVGRLYAWSDLAQVCPEGWRPPTPAEWNSLESAARNLASHLKSTRKWLLSDLRATDSLGFAAIPSGAKNNGSWVGKDTLAIFWSSMESLSDYSFARSMSLNSEKFITLEAPQSNLYAVRCVK